MSEITKWYGSKNRNIHVIGHSLGSRVILKTSQENAARYVKWGKALLLAAAVHKNVYFHSFSGTNNVPDYSWVYYSSGDWVLKYFYTLYYWLFDRSVEGTTQHEKWQKLSLEGKLEYMRELEERCLKGGTPDNDFDRNLLEGIQRSSIDAMGYTGADLGNPVSITKVANVEMTKYVDGHSYWENTEMQQRIVQALK
jgi:pimeloyl-ACP methyl ester carboxylesterase